MKSALAADVALLVTGFGMGGLHLQLKAGYCCASRETSRCCMEWCKYNWRGRARPQKQHIGAWQPYSFQRVLRVTAVLLNRLLLMTAKCVEVGLATPEHAATQGLQLLRTNGAHGKTAHAADAMEL